MNREGPILIFGKNAWKAMLLLWVFLWALFFFRNLFFKGYKREYAELLGRPNLDDKRAYVTGEALYETIRACNAKMPQGATFGYSEIEEGSLADRRIRYYLYPHLKSDNPDYLIIFDGKEFSVRKAR